MRASSTLTEQQREHLVDLFEQGTGDRAAASELRLKQGPVRSLYRSWQLHGRLCLMEKRTNAAYSFEIKKEIVDRHAAGETKMDLAKEFNLSSHKQVERWSKQHREGGDEALMTKPKGRPKSSEKPVVLSEEDKLRRELKRVQAENAYLKKIAGLEEPGARLKTLAIAILKSDHDLADLLQAAGLTRSTYYYHAQRLTEPDKHQKLKEDIQTIFTESKHRFGYRRVRIELVKMGWRVSKKLVWKLMDELNLKSKVRIRRKYTSYNGKTSHIAENLLKRQFQSNVVNTKWVSDVTEFRVAGRKLYLSPIMDLYDHCIISHTISASPTTAFTSASLAEAFESQTPASGLLVHTDQGFHYQHSSWHRLLTKHGAVQSMSRKGNCFDNSVMENFFGHLKSEMYHGEYFSTVAELTREINEYIDWYNNVRCQERLQGMAPIEYRCHTLQLDPSRL